MMKSSSMFQSTASAKYYVLYFIQNEIDNFIIEPGNCIAGMFNKLKMTMPEQNLQNTLDRVPTDFYKGCSNCLIVKIENQEVVKAWEVTSNTLGKISTKSLNLSGDLKIPANSLSVSLLPTEINFDSATHRLS